MQKRISITLGQKKSNENYFFKFYLIKISSLLHMNLYMLNKVLNVPLCMILLAQVNVFLAWFPIARAQISFKNLILFRLYDRKQMLKSCSKETT